MPSQIGSVQIPADDALVKAVNDAYSARAKEGVTQSYAKNVAEAFGYTPQQLQSIPHGANMGLSCGNPVGTANIEEGEVVVDLGSGGGIDIFLAAQKVGSKGQAIGLDGSPDMIALARTNARKHGLTPPQCSFVQTSLTDPLPLHPDSVDCFISNCVINLLPRAGKASIIKEMYKVLRPGGRLVLDDMVAKEPLPPNILTDLSAHINCVAGSITVDEYTQLLTEAGFVDVLLVDTKSDFNVYYQASAAEAQGGCCAPTPTSSGCCPPKVTPAATSMKPVEAGFDANKWVAAYQIYALKTPAGTVEQVPPSTRRETLLRWWDVYPPPASQPSLISGDELAVMMRDKAMEGEWAVIDVRRDDWVGGHVKHSFNHHAQTFHNGLPEFYEKYKDVSKVIFYCVSSNGRGPRCAGWYQDYLNSQERESKTSASKAYVLEGGVKAWKAKFVGDKDMVGGI